MHQHRLCKSVEENHCKHLNKIFWYWSCVWNKINLYSSQSDKWITSTGLLSSTSEECFVFFAHVFCLNSTITPILAINRRNCTFKHLNCQQKYLQFLPFVHNCSSCEMIIIIIIPCFMRWLLVAVEILQYICLSHYVHKNYDHLS